MLSQIERVMPAIRGVRLIGRVFADSVLPVDHLSPSRGPLRASVQLAPFFRRHVIPSRVCPAGERLPGWLLRYHTAAMNAPQLLNGARMATEWRTGPDWCQTPSLPFRRPWPRG